MLLSTSTWFMIAGLTTQIISTSLGNVLPPETLLSFNDNDKQAKRTSRVGSEPDTFAESREVHPGHSATQPLFAEHARSHTLQRELEVTDDSPHCQLSEGVLNCDFSWSQQEVYAPSFPKTDRTIKELFITNVRHLKLSKAYCPTLILHNVEEVLTVEDSSRPVCQNMTIELLNVTLDKLPSTLKSLHARDSKIISCILGESAEVASITDSKIQYLRIHAENNRMQLVLRNTVVERVQNLKISGTASLKSYNCSINNLPGDGIIINATGNVMDGIVFPRDGTTKNGIVLIGGADLELGDIKGKVHIKSPMSLTGKQNYHGTYFHEGSLTNSSRYLDPCISKGSDYDNHCVDTSRLIMIILIFSLFLNITQILFDQPGKLIKTIVQGRRKPHLTLTEACDKDDDGDSIHSHEKPLLNDDYLLARRISSLDPLHIRRVSVVDSKGSEVHTVTRVVPLDPSADGHHLHHHQRSHDPSADEHHLHHHQRPHDTADEHHLHHHQRPHDTADEHHLHHHQRPHRPEHSAGRIRKRTPQKHNFWKGNKSPRHPLKRSFTVGAADMKYYPRRDSIPSHQSGSGHAFPMAVMGNPMQSTQTQTQ